MKLEFCSFYGHRLNKTFISVFLAIARVHACSDLSMTDNTEL